jgi:hypothetical protein
MVYGIGCVGGVWVVIRAIRHPNSPFENWHYGFVLSWFLTPIVITWAVSLRHPIFVNKYLIICLPSLVLLAALGICQIERRWLFASASTLLVLLGWNLERFYTTPANDDWRGATSDFVRRAVRTDGMAFFNPIGQFPFEYYARRDMPAGMIGNLVSPKRFDGVAGDTVESYARFSARYPRIWLFEGNVLSSAELESRQIKNVLATHYLTVSHSTFRGVTVLMYSNEGQHASYDRP